MSAAKVSVLIPCYNAASYVAATLDSVFAQTWPNIEVIVVNDGSTDNSLDILNGYARPELRIVTQVNKGQTAALNRCLAHASGDYIQFLDADDLIAPDKIALQIARLEKAPGCIATSEWGRFYTTPDSTVFEATDVQKDLQPLDWLASGMEMMFPAMWLTPRSVVEKAGPWREDLTLNNDAEYFTRVVLAAECVLFCEGARSYYRSGVPGSLSQSRSPQAWTSQLKVIEACQDLILGREDSDRIRKVFAIKWQQLAHSAYPYSPDLAADALRRARALHDIRIRPDGGAKFRFLSRLIGWRMARRLQVSSGRP